MTGPRSPVAPVAIRTGLSHTLEVQHSGHHIAVAHGGQCPRLPARQVLEARLPLHGREYNSKVAFEPPPRLQVAESLQGGPPLGSPAPGFTRRRRGGQGAPGSPLKMAGEGDSSRSPPPFQQELRAPRPAGFGRVRGLSLTSQKNLRGAGLLRPAAGYLPGFLGVSPSPSPGGAASSAPPTKGRCPGPGCLQGAWASPGKGLFGIPRAGL